MLLADVDATQTVATGASVIACLLAAITGVFSWLSGRENRLANRDKLEFDASVATMKRDIEHLKDETADCHEARETQGAEIAELRRRLDDRSAEHRSDRRQGADPEYRGPKRRAADAD